MQAVKHSDDIIPIRRGQGQVTRNAPAIKMPSNGERIPRGDLCDIFHVTRTLHLRAQTIATIVDHVRNLVRTAHFPPPNPRWVKGQMEIGHLAVSAKSVWQRALVEAWAEQQRAPGVLGALEQTIKAQSISRDIDARLSGEGTTSFSAIIQLLRLLP